MSAREIITEAIWYKGNDETVLKQYRINLRRIADALTTPTLIEDWTTATDNIDKRLYRLGIPQ